MEVVECSATDLIGSYIGQTGPKTIKQLERGLGKVLFVDEAYRLGSGHFAQEAIDELVDSVTKPKFAGKMVIILAGYDKDMNDLLRVNEGLSSRFADEIIFPSLDPDHCLQLLVTKIQQSNISITLNDPQFRVLMAELAGLPAWGNARDVQTLAKSMVRSVFQANTTTSQLVLSEELAMKCMEAMLDDRRKRSKMTLSSLPISPAQPQPQHFAPSQAPPPTQVNTATAPNLAPQEEVLKDEPPPLKQMDDDDPARDAGVSDAIWAQLQLDKQAAMLEAQRQEKMIKDREADLKATEKAEKQLAAELAALREIQAKNEAEANELLKKCEEARIKELNAKAFRELIKQELERQRKMLEEKRRLEAQAQQKLRQIGVCSMGYRWTKQSGGYRCAGGSHWVFDGQLGM